MGERLSGKMVAITGAAQGIGKATATALVAEGMSVAIGDLDLELARKTAAELGDKVIALELDVTEMSSVESFLMAAEDALGPLDVMINNAGIMIVGDFMKEEERATDLQIDVNVRGVLNGCKAAARRMSDRGEGHIVNIASAAGKVALPRLVTYTASKHAVVGLSDALRAELRDHGIQVSTIMPNVVNTRLGAGTGKSFIPAVEAEDVARTIVGILRSRGNEAFVPGYLELVRMTTAGLPTGIRDGVVRLLGGHNVMRDTDDNVRNAYQADALKDQKARR